MMITVGIHAQAYETVLQVCNNCVHKTTSKRELSGGGFANPFKGVQNGDNFV